MRVKVFAHKSANRKVQTFLASDDHPWGLLTLKWGILPGGQDVATQVECFARFQLDY